VKLHGTLDDENSIIITDDDYTKAIAGEHEQALFHWFAATLLVETVVFVGYSLNDPNILYLYEELRKISGREKFDHYIVNGENPDENDIKRWSKQGVKFLPLKARDFFRLVYIETNRFINRDEQRALEKVSLFRYFLILGNAGLGKTTLLQRIHDDLVYKGSSRFTCFHYENYSRKQSKNPVLAFLKFLESFAINSGIPLKEIPKEHIVEEALVKQYLSEAIATVRKEIKRPTLLLFDCTTNLDPVYAHFLGELIEDEKQDRMLYSVVASRFEIEWPDPAMRRLFRRNRDTLKPFDGKQDIPQWIKFQFLYSADTYLSGGDAKRIAAQIKKLTYGHPGAIKLVMEELTKEYENCKNVEVALTYLHSQSATLIEKIYQEIIRDQIMQDLDPEIKEFFGDSLCILRKYNASTFDIFKKTGLTRLRLVQMINEQNLSSVSSGGENGGGRGPFYKLDEIVRGILSTRMKVQQKSRYIELNKAATEFYQKYLDHWADDLQREAILEWIWHSLCCIEPEKQNLAKVYDDLCASFKTAISGLHSSGGPSFVPQLRKELFHALDQDDEIEDKFLEIFNDRKFFNDFLNIV
jgi:hypothetical protein